MFFDGDWFLDLDFNMVHSLWETHHLNFGSVYVFESAKIQGCETCRVFAGLWLTHSSMGV